MWRHQNKHLGDDVPEKSTRLVPRPLVQAQSQFEAEDICETLRAAGIKCGWRNEVDPNQFMGVGGLADVETRFEVYVDELQIGDAQQVLSERNSGGSGEQAS